MKCANWTPFLAAATAAAALLLTLGPSCAVARRCKLNSSRWPVRNSKDSEERRGIKNHLAGLVPAKADDGTSYLFTEILVALTDAADGDCTVGMSFGEGDDGGGGNVTELKVKASKEEPWPTERWFVEPYYGFSGYYYVKYVTIDDNSANATDEPEFAPVGKYYLHFEPGTDGVPFFNVHGSAAAAGGREHAFDREDVAAELGDEDSGVVPAGRSFTTCLEYHEFSRHDPADYLACRAVQRAPGGGENLVAGACVVNLPLDSALESVNVTVVNRTFGLGSAVSASGAASVPDDLEFIVRCDAATLGQSLHKVDLKFTASNPAAAAVAWSTGSTVLASVAVAVALMLLLFMALLLADHYFCPDRGLFFLPKYTFLKATGRHDSTMMSSAGSSLARCRRMPVRPDRQHTVVSELMAGDDYECGYGYSGGGGSGSGVGDPETMTSFSESAAASDIWPKWILEARLMRFPGRDIEFDASKPLGCGNYGYVYNGSVKYGTASFDVAIKQAKSVDSEAQDELLQEAEKLARLRDHPNVVNIKGITLETAEDGLCRKYSLVLTLYTSGNLEGYLRNNREQLCLDRDEARMKKWAFQVASGMEFISSKGILHLDLATRNILLTHPAEIAKISDFGLSRFIDEIQPGEKFGSRGLPIAWLPLEIWRTGTLSTHASPFVDVWSYGVLLWEVFTLGGLPYDRELKETAASHYLKGSTSKHERLSLFLKFGHRLPSPWAGQQAGVSPDAAALYGLMLKCWNLEPGRRPTFKQVVETLQALLNPCAFKEQQDETDQERQKYFQLDFDNHEYLQLVDCDDDDEANTQT